MNQITSQCKARNDSLHNIRLATQADDNLAILKYIIQQGYLLIVDYTSRFPIVRKLKSMSAQHITEHFKFIFSEYGWPDTVVSDNGPCYAAEVFSALMKEYAVNHITSSPHYPQSNRLAEKFVQIVKNLFHKVTDEGADIDKYLMIYCNTPLASTSKSPMQMLQQRSARLPLPMSNAARRKLGIVGEQQSSKNQQLPSHDFTLTRMSCVKVLSLRDGFLL